MTLFTGFINHLEGKKLVVTKKQQLYIGEMKSIKKIKLLTREISTSKRSVDLGGTRDGIP